MAGYKVSQGNIFGRVGEGFGRGLAESLPKEIERSRLASGLESLANEEGLSPFQKFSRLASLPGTNPQIIQSGENLLRQEGMRKNIRENKGLYGQTPNERLQVDLNLGKNITDRLPPSRSEPIRQDRNIHQENIEEQNLIGGGNPTRDTVKTFQPPTPTEFQDKLGDIWDSNPQLDFNQARDLTEDYFSKLANQPEAVRAEDKRLEDARSSLNNEFKKELELKLQKQGPDTFQDLTGDMQNNLFRSMQRDLIDNPKMSKENAINKWTSKALELVKMKDELNGLARQNSIKAFFNEGTTLDKVNNAQKYYSDSGNLEEFYDFLRTENSEPTRNANGDVVQAGRTGMGWSSGQAAQAAFPRSNKVKSYINGMDTKNFKDASKAAIDISQVMTRNDSPLAIARNIFNKNPEFDVRSFLRTMSDYQKDFGLSPRQIKELSADDRAVLPNWNDIWFLPDQRGLNK